jgi:hypothetical protein
LDRDWAAVGGLEHVGHPDRHHGWCPARSGYYRTNRAGSLPAVREHRPADREGDGLAGGSAVDQLARGGDAGDRRAVHGGEHVPRPQDAGRRETRLGLADDHSGNGGECIEVASPDGVVTVRDTKQDGTGPVLRFTPAAWRRFADQVKRSLAGGAGRTGMATRTWVAGPVITTSAASGIAVSGGVRRNLKACVPSGNAHGSPGAATCQFPAPSVSHQEKPGVQL